MPTRPLRLWPGVVLVLVQWFLWMVLPAIAPESVLVGMIGGLLAGPLIVLWWVGFSRAPWVDRLGAVVVMGIGVAATQRGRRAPRAQRRRDGRVQPAAAALTTALVLTGAHGPGRSQRLPAMSTNTATVP